ncbi:MAG: nitroreductase family protein [Lentimicrobiaceae bacterium]|nr:nitroreductase family protein [Lentimicrobiaceae bacterium]
MDFHELITKRQSERQYDTRPVEAEKIMLCIEAARMAPSACNAQPWKFIVVDEPELKTQLANAIASMGMNKFAFDAPAIVAIVLEKPNVMSKIGSVLKGKEYTLMDIGIAATHFCLQATELGLGTCIIGWFDEKKVRKLLQIPNKKRIPLLLTVGYSTDELRKKQRKELNVVHSSNKY